jgi:uncharacterized membrane protein YbhN (UPF0104 family)
MSAKTAISLLFYAVVIAFLVYYLRGLELSALSGVRIGWGYLILGIALAIAQRFLFPLVWVIIVKDMGVRVRDYAEYNLVYAKAWLGRYIPGKIAMVAARIYFSERLGAPRSVITVSTLLEIGVLLLVAAVVGILGIATLGNVYEEIREYAVITYAMIGVLSFLLLPPIFNVLLRIAFAVFDRSGKAKIPSVHTLTVTKGIVGFIVVVAVMGVYINLMAAAIAPELLDYYVFVWGTYSLAGVLGMAFVFAPSGLGVREAVQLPLLSLLIPKEVALAVVVMNRIAETCVDAGFYALSVLIARLR